MGVAILATAHQQLFVSMTAGAVAFGVAMLAIAAVRVPPEQRRVPKAMWTGMVKGLT
jgi:hypothetical protein